MKLKKKRKKKRKTCQVLLQAQVVNMYEELTSFTRRG